MRAASEYGTIDVLQPPYNMFWRFIEGDQLPYCQEHGIGVMAYSALAQGLLTGNLTAATTFPEGDKRPTTALFQPGVYERCLAAVAALRPIAAGAGLTVPQLALAWLLAQPGVSTALVGARTVAEIEENVPGATAHLSARPTRRRRTPPRARSSKRCRACRTCSRTGRTGSYSAAATSRPASFQWV